MAFNQVFSLLHQRCGQVYNVLVHHFDDGVLFGRGTDCVLYILQEQQEQQEKRYRAGGHRRGLCACWGDPGGVVWIANWPATCGNIQKRAVWTEPMAHVHLRHHCCALQYFNLCDARDRRTGTGKRVHALSCLQVPNLDQLVVGAADNTESVCCNGPNTLDVAKLGPDTLAGLEVPKLDGVIQRSR
ncbi:hypothetical protein OGATHE_003666 [Ogataea polymorpha]|uniref:Uncharacterized protein n=1 Tax=Ogataea polymorpha TaxID=460523 RepID=A0A9P8T4H0_9ASCO|nr:hypothetical protein OGATHE_003666 [Ogataea polymorpha]